MPNIKSAKKRMRSNAKKADVNTLVSSSMKTAIKKFEKEVKAGNKEEASNNLTTEMIGKTYGFLKVLKLGKYENTSENKRRRKVICECLLCGDIIEVRTNYLKSGDITSCGKHNKSRGEIYVRNFLNLNNYAFHEEYIFSDLIDKNPLRFDFGILNKENKIIGCIEIQGSQHYNDKNGWYNSNIVKHDQMKKEYCYEKNISLQIRELFLLIEEIKMI